MLLGVHGHRWISTGIFPEGFIKSRCWLPRLSLGGLRRTPNRCSHLHAKFLHIPSFIPWICLLSAQQCARHVNCTFNLDATRPLGRRGCTECSMNTFPEVARRTRRPPKTNMTGRKGNRASHSGVLAARVTLPGETLREQTRGTETSKQPPQTMRQHNRTGSKSSLHRATFSSTSKPSQRIPQVHLRSAEEAQQTLTYIAS